MNPPKEPKNLGIKIGTKTEALWNNVLNSSKQAVEQAEQTIQIQKEIIVLAGRKVKEEERKRKV